jgi:hypothetical protein
MAPDVVRVSTSKLGGPSDTADADPHALLAAFHGFRVHLRSVLADAIPELGSGRAAELLTLV